MGNTYLSSCLSTIEKQFGIKSQEAAWVFSGNEISQIPLIFFLPFLRKHNVDFYRSIGFLKLLDMLTIIAVIYLN